AVIQVTKSVNVTSADVGQEIEYTLTYNNNGNTAISGLILQDVLSANTSYVANSGIWSGSATARTDTAGDETGPTNAAYSVTGNTINFVIGTVAPNTNGTLKFKVRVNAGVAAGVISNTASFDVDGPAGALP
ncbi:isopeptide-forming domain-containing fimbrial protein, partial [Rhizobium hidalgonense]